MSIFYEVAELSQPSDEQYAVIRIDTAKARDGGCEGVVVSLHDTQEEAEAAANCARNGVYQ